MHVGHRVDVSGRTGGPLSFPDRPLPTTARGTCPTYFQALGRAHAYIIIGLRYDKLYGTPRTFTTEPARANCKKKLRCDYETSPIFFDFFLYLFYSNEFRIDLAQRQRGKSGTRNAVIDTCQVQYNFKTSIVAAPISIGRRYPSVIYTCLIINYIQCDYNNLVVFDRYLRLP